MKKNSEDSIDSEKKASNGEKSKKGERYEKIENRIKSSIKDVNDHVGKLRRKVITSNEVQKMTERFEKLLIRGENPAFLLKLDEFGFSFGVLSIFFTFALLFYPKTIVLATWITVINLVLILIRFIEYKSKSWHYYFFDYCYYVNIGTWVYLWAFPKSFYVFFMISVNAFCPLLNYFIIFKPKLIYQSQESLTSFYMHYTPSLLFWILRYYNDSGKNYLTSSEIQDYLYADGWRSQARVFFYGFSFYICWAVLYYLFIFQIRKERIEKRGYQTLYSYTVCDMKQFNGFILKYGEKWAPLFYMILHMFQGFMGCVMSMIFINFWIVSFVALFCYLFIPIWNSSIYYFEYFSKDYNRKLVLRADHNKEKRIKRSISNKGKLSPARKYSEEVSSVNK